MAAAYDWTVGAPAADEMPALVESTRYAFGLPTADKAQNWLEQQDERFAVRCPELGAVGGCGWGLNGVWVRGKSVTAVTITAVSVSPAARGTGAGKALVRGLLQACVDRNVPVATLYASAQRFYRGAGFEDAVAHGSTKFAIASFARVPMPAGVVARPLPDRAAAEPALRALYAANAPSGFLDRRNAYFWDRVFRDSPGTGHPATAYGFYSGEQLIAYVVVSHVPRHSYVKDLDVRDAHAASADGWRAIASFLGGHQTTAVEVTVKGAVAHPLLLHSDSPPPDPEVSVPDFMLVRVVDVVDALQARGYSTMAAGRAVNLRVADSVLPHNDGAFLLEVGADGSATVARGAGTGEVELDVRALAQLFVGHSSIRALVMAGLAVCPEALYDLVDLVFGVEGAPCLADSF